MKLTNKFIGDLLRERGLSVTNSRIEIIKCLNDDVSHFHTVNDIAMHTKQNKKTIYNNLKELSKTGLIDFLSIGGVPKYAFNDNINKESNEIHLINKNGDIFHIIIDENIFNLIEKEIKDKGHKPLSIKIYANTK